MPLCIVSAVNVWCVMFVGCSIRHSAKQRQCNRISFWCQTRCSVVRWWLCHK